MSFGTRLKKIRTASHVTQQELADYLNVTRPTIAGYETKGKEPDYKTLSMIAAYFNVSIDYLLSGKDYPGSLDTFSSSKEYQAFYEEYMLLKPDTKKIVPQLLQQLQEMDEQDIKQLLEYSSLLLCQPKYHNKCEK